MKKLIFLLSLVLFATELFSQPKFRSGIFLHLNVGNNIWGPNGSQTSVPQEIADYNALHGYFGSDACNLQRQQWPSNPANNEWYRWNLIFNNLDPLNDIRPLMQSNRIIIIKASFDASQITGWGAPSDTLLPINKTIYNYKWHWRKFIKIMESNPDNFFVIWTNAPLVAAATNDQEAMYSHNFCKWAKDTLARGLDQLYGEFPPNVYVFDYFHILVGIDYKLQLQYAAGADDSHPNALATELVAPRFVSEIFDAAIEYENNYVAIQPPEITYPTQNQADVPINPTVKWKIVDGATQYRLQIATDVQYNNIVFDEFTSSSSIQVTGLQYDRQYVCHAKAIKNQQTESAWSLSVRFTTVVEPPKAPILIEPANNAVQIPLKPIFRWHPVTKANSYRLQVARDKEFNYRVINTGFIEDTSYQPSETLEYGMKYYWHVMAKNAGGESPWSDSSIFTAILPLPAQPTLISPDNDAADINPDTILKWQKATFAEKYNLLVAEDTLLYAIVVNKSLTDTSYKLKGELKNKKKYYWAVYASNLSGNGDTSEIRSFTTIAALPAQIKLISPINNTSNVPLLPTFLWMKDDNASEYDLQIATDTAMTQLHFSLEDFEGTKYIYNSQTDSTLEENKKYFWHVRAKNSAGTGLWSDVWSFTTESTIGVESYENIEETLHIYPNPAYNCLTIACSQHFPLPLGESVRKTGEGIEIYDVLGVRVLIPPLPNKSSHSGYGKDLGEVSLDVSSLPTGRYYITVNTGGERIAKQFAVVR